MRVAVDTNGLFTGQAGVARSIRGLLQGLKAAPDLDITPFAWEVPNFGYRQPARSAKTFYRELVWGKLVAPLRLRREGYDLYHAIGSYFVQVPKGMRRIVTLNDLAILRYPERFRRWQRWSEPPRLRRLHTVDRVICISRFTAEEAMTLLGLPSSKLEVVHLASDFQPAQAAPREQMPDFSVPPEFFLFVGSLEPGKNLGLLRQAYELAAEARITLPPLLIVGARWAGVGTEGRPPQSWQYLGRQPDGVLVHLYGRALALVFPSKYEGFGIPVVEAMTLGCPVVCSPVASLPELGGEAVLWTELDPANYLKAMRRLATDGRLRQELALAGCEQSKQFTWDRCGKAVAEIYREVASKTRAA